MGETSEQERMREENRRRYPGVARFVDEVRKHWPNAVVTDIRKMQPDEYRQRYLELKRCQSEARKQAGRASRG